MRSATPREALEVELQTENGMPLQRLTVRPAGARALVRTPKIDVEYEVDESTAAAILAPVQ